MEHENDPDLDEPLSSSQGNVVTSEEPPEGRTPEAVPSDSGQDGAREFHLGLPRLQNGRNHSLADQVVRGAIAGRLFEHSKMQYRKSIKRIV